MKKFYVLFAATAAVALTACEPEATTLPGDQLEEIEENCGPEYPNAEPCK